MLVYEAVASALEELPTDTLFGLMGDGNMHYMAQWMATGGRTVQTVVEGGAVGMADGFSRTTGRLGLVTVTHGPAVTNMLTALTEAVRAGSRVLVLTGDTASKPHERQHIDLRAAAGLAGAEYRRVHRPVDVVDDVVGAARRVMTGRVPMILDIPYDLLHQEVDPGDRRTRPTSWDARVVLPDPDVLDRALGVVASARRPVVLAGQGCSSPISAAALVELGDLLDGVFATTLLGQGLFHGHDFDLGVFGTVSTPVAREAIDRADCVIAFGASLNQYTTVDNSLLAGKRVVHVDTDACHLDRFVDADVAVLGDATAVARAMVEALRTAELDRGSFRSEALRAALADRRPEQDFTDTSRAGTIDIRTACIALDSRLPADRLVVTDGGRFRSAVWPYLHVARPRSFVHTVNFGAIGLGTAVGIGAAVGNPDRVTVSLTGDGGGAMALNEFIVAVRHQLPFVFVMFNDGAYGAEYRKLPDFGFDAELSLMEWPEFAEVAESLGGHGRKVCSMEDLEDALTMIDDRRLPLFLDVQCDPDMVIPKLY